LEENPEKPQRREKRQGWVRCSVKDSEKLLVKEPRQNKERKRNKKNI